MEERQLIEECKRGDSRARKTLYELHASAMMSLCQRYVCNLDTARDLMHDGFVKLFTKIHTYSGLGSFNGWMRRIFVTTALEHLRRNRIRQYGAETKDPEFEEQDPELSLFEHLSADDLFACIARLPEKYRIVFNMHAIEEYTHVEIAQALEISENTVRSQYARARQMLQRMVTKIWNTNK
ncbi:MAG: RNA polymerase sigma factor [Bacteroidetes bacterium]|nr:RNA polymerase sigma factor [Bacteroidota bacterium]